MADSLLKDLLTTFFKALDGKSIPFCVLRNYEGLPEHTSNDVDILIPFQFIEESANLLNCIAGGIGLRAHMRTEFACLLVIFHSNDDRCSQIHIDLYHDISWKGVTIVNPGRVLAHRRPYNGFHIPSPAHEHSVNLLERLIYHGHVKDEYREGIHKSALHPCHGIQFLAELEKSVGRHEGRLLWKLTRDADWVAIGTRAGSIRKAIIQKNIVHDPSGLLRRQAGQIERFVRRLFYPAGVSVAIIGPDGAGKSTVIGRLREALGVTFSDKQCIVHWRPDLVRFPGKSTQEPVSDPHGKSERNRIISVLFLVYHTLLFMLGYWLRLALLRFKGWAVWLDRYYYDFFVDLSRFRLSVSQLWVRFGYALVPKPDIVILLDAQPEVIRTRKREVAPEETIRQCAAYRDLIDVLPNGVMVNADQPIDCVTEDALEIILAYLSGRVERQWGQI